MKVLLEAIIGYGLPITLNRIAKGGAETALLSERLQKRALLINGREGRRPWVPLAPDWKALEGRMSAGRRSDMRRMRRRAERLGKVEFDVVIPDQATVGDYLRQLYQVEAASWKGRHGSAILMRPRMERFYTSYGYAAARLGILRLFFLRINGQVIAGRLAVEHADRLWDLKIGYDEKWRECSPGILLTHETLRYACERGLVAHEFLGDEAPWELTWPCKFHEYASPRFYPMNIRGTASLTADVCRFASSALSRAWKNKVSMSIMLAK